MTRYRGDPSDPDSILSIRDAVILALTAVAVASAARLIVLPVSVIDWDESIYLLVSRDLLQGRLPYEGVFDHKPISAYRRVATFLVLCSPWLRQSEFEIGSS